MKSKYQKPDSSKRRIDTGIKKATDQKPATKEVELKDKHSSASRALNVKASAKGRDNSKSFTPRAAFPKPEGYIEAKERIARNVPPKKRDIRKNIDQLQIEDKETSTAWNKPAQWYDNLVGQEGSEYHQKVILPGIERMLKAPFGTIEGLKIIDLACGQGVLCRRLSTAGARATGLDLSAQLIEKAASYNKGAKNEPGYKVWDITQIADEKGNIDPGLKGIEAKSYDAVTLILSLQNIGHLTALWRGVRALLKPNGVFIAVLMHPCFRVPQHSDWFMQKRENRHSRIMWRYLSGAEVDVVINPGQVARGQEAVVAKHFHRPLQAYVNTMATAGLIIEHLEEWVSHKEEQEGPYKEIKDTARGEFPLFLAFRCRLQEVSSEAEAYEVGEAKFGKELKVEEAAEVTHALEAEGDVEVVSVPFSSSNLWADGLKQDKNVKGVGIDLVEITRVEEALKRQGEGYIKKMLSDKEFQLWQNTNIGLNAAFLAGRWAAKEAAAKALGSGFSQGINWRQVQVFNDQLGKPYLSLDGKAKELAIELNMGELLLSITHEKGMAMALVLTLAKEESDNNEADLG